MQDEKLVEGILEMVRDPHLKMTKRRHLGRLIRDPAQPLADAKDMGINSKTWALEAE